MNYEKRIFLVRTAKKGRITYYNEPDIRWHDENYYACRSLGNPKPSIIRNPARPELSHGSTVYDCRVLSPEHQVELDAVDAEIKRLVEERRDFLENIFQTCPIADRNSFDSPVPGKSKEDAEKGLPNVIGSPIDVKGEREILNTVRKLSLTYPDKPSIK